MFMRVASLYDATAFAWGFCRASHHGMLVKREWVTNCVVKSSGFLVVFFFLFTVTESMARKRLFVCAQFYLDFLKGQNSRLG